MAAKKKEADVKELNTENIFKQGVLVSLRTRLWGATGQIKDHQFKIIDDTLDKNAIHASMDLLKDRRLILAMRQTRASAQRFIQANSLPFPEIGFAFVPKSRIEKVAEVLDEHRNEFLAYGKELAKEIKKLESDFAEAHPKMYNPEKYPSEAQLLNSIYFEYTFRVFTAPDETLGVISPEMYKAEMRKFKADIQRMKDDTVSIICKELQERIGQLASQCDDGKVNQATLNSFGRLMKKFDTVWGDFVDEADVKSIMKDLDLYLAGTDSAMLKYDDDFRGMVATKAKEISKTLENKGYKRSIDI